MLDSYVLGYGVAAPGTAAQGKGGKELKVIKVTDSAVRGGSVDHDPAGLHGCRMFCHLLFLVGIDVKGGSVAVAAVLD